MDSDKGILEGNDCLTSAMQMIYTYPTQNSSKLDYQDAGHGNPLRNSNVTKLTTFWSAGNSYLASKIANHFLVLT